MDKKPNQKMRALWTKMQRDQHGSPIDRLSFGIFDFVDDCMRAGESYAVVYFLEMSEKLPTYKMFEFIEICDIILPVDEEEKAGI